MPEQTPTIISWPHQNEPDTSHLLRSRAGVMVSTMCGLEGNLPVYYVKRRGSVDCPDCFKTE